jgi:transcription elongation GreA/GreB family factor
MLRLKMFWSIDLEAERRPTISIAPSEIAITHADHRILFPLIQQAYEAGHLVAASRLADKLRRAHVVSADGFPPDRLGLYAVSRYVETRSGAIREQTLVPGWTSSSPGIVSVFSERGAALLGLSVGQIATWLDAQDRPRSIRLLDVRRAQC